jgi:hypothetical protein
VLQARDVEIIKLVAQHRVIASDDLQLLISGSDQSVLRRLQKLFHNGYLDRPRSQRLRGNAPMVYALGQKGAVILAHENPPIDWSEKNRQVGPLFLEHALMISRFQTTLRFALAAQGKAVIDRWLPDGLVRDSVKVEHDGEFERFPIAPDALFTLRLVDEREGRNRIHVFLEADRGTMTTKRFLTKMHGYWHFWRSGQQQRYDVENFLVVTVTRTAERATSLCELTANVDSPERRGLRMFLFAPEGRYIGNPAAIVESIWWTADDGDLHSLLE